MGILRRRPSGPTINKSSSDSLALALEEAYALKGVKRAGADLLNVSLGELARIGGVQTRSSDTLGLQLAEAATRIIRFNALTRSDALNISLGESATSGLISFTTTAIVVDEGTIIQISAQRTAGYSGQISVQWGITGLTEGSPTPASGTFTWNSGESGVKSANVTLGFVTSTRTGSVTLSNPLNLSGGMVPTIIGTNPISIQINNTLEYTSAFAGTENPISENGNWKVGAVTGFYQSGRKANNRCFGTGTSGSNFDDCLNILQGHSVSQNHRVDLTLRKVPGYNPLNSHEVEILGRFFYGGAGSFARGYEVLISHSASQFQIVKWLGIGYGSENFQVLSTNGSPPAVNDGDVFRADFIGNQILVYRNGVLFNTTTDPTDPWLDGSMGFGFFIRPGLNPEDYCITSWSGRNL